MVGAQAQELVGGRLHLGLRPPFVIAFEGAFAGDSHAVHLADSAEVLEQGAVGQAGGKATEVLRQEAAGEVAAQCAPAVELVVLLGFGADFFAAPEPAFEIGLQQLGFQAALDEQTVDAQELVAQIAVVDIALDGGQDLREGRLKGNNQGVRHGARL